MVLMAKDKLYFSYSLYPKANYNASFMPVKFVPEAH